MGVQRLSDKKRKLCEEILRRPIIVATTTDEHYVAQCWVADKWAALVDYKRGRVVHEAEHTGCWTLRLDWANEERYMQCAMREMSEALASNPFK
jgi:hypothetical protein